MGAILRYHGIGYHIYADNTQLYLSFKCDNPSITLSKLNNCISDIRVWMIKNRLKIKDSKTEFIVFRSPQAKQDLSGLSSSVGDSAIAQSSKVRDLGVIFDQFLNFDDYLFIYFICIIHIIMVYIYINYTNSKKNIYIYIYIDSYCTMKSHNCQLIN